MANVVIVGAQWGTRAGQGRRPLFRIRRRRRSLRRWCQRRAYLGGRRQQDRHPLNSVGSSARSRQALRAGRWHGHRSPDPCWKSWPSCVGVGCWLTIAIWSSASGHTSSCRSAKEIDRLREEGKGRSGPPSAASGRPTKPRWRVAACASATSCPRAGCASGSAISSKTAAPAAAAGRTAPRCRGDHAAVSGSGGSAWRRSSRTRRA